MENVSLIRALPRRRAWGGADESGRPGSGKGTIGIPAGLPPAKKKRDRDGCAGNAGEVTLAEIPLSTLRDAGYDDA
jgi:hypothetical protein